MVHAENERQARARIGCATESEPLLDARSRREPRQCQSTIFSRCSEDLMSVPEVVEPSSGQRIRRALWAAQARWAPVLFILPFLAVFICFMLYPLGRSLAM